VAGIICIVAPVLSIAFRQRNLLDPQFLFSTIWQGANPDKVWQTAGSGFPGGHFWINHLAYGDGLIQLGVVLAGSSAGLALLGTAIAFLKQKPRSYGWALLSLVICILIFLSAIGLYTQTGS
jgi:hypothetical protein